MAIPCQITAVLPHRPAIPQIVMRLHQTLKQLGLPRRGHRLDPYRQQLTQRAGNRGLVHRQGHRAAMPKPIVGAAHRRRQGNQTPFLELAQQRTGRHVLVRPPCVDPIPVATQFLGQPCSMPIGVVGQQLTDKPEVLFCDWTALYSRTRLHGQDNSPFQTGSPVKNAGCTGLLRSYDFDDARMSVLGSSFSLATV